MTTHDIGELDTAEASAFVAAVAPLFEGAPRFLSRLAAGRPFGAWEALFAAARAIAHRMPEPDQIELIDAHPRLGAPPGMVSSLSYREQGYDRPETGGGSRSVDLAAELERLNEAYEARFGFRYCVFVAGRPREALLDAMAAAVGADRMTELHRGLDAVIDIAMARHEKLAEES